MADNNAIKKSMLNQMGSPAKASIIPTPMHPGAEVNKAHKSDWFSTGQKRIVTRVSDALKKQDFGPDDSVIVSALMNPKDAINRGGEWFRHNVSVAGGGDPYDNPSPLLSPTRQEYSEAGTNLAGLAQLGGMPGAPSSAGGTLGTFIGPKAKGWDAKKAELARQLLDSGADPAQVWKEHLIGKMPDGSLFSEINDRNFTLNHPYELIQAGRYSGWKDDAMNHPALFQEYPQFEYDPLKMQIGKSRGGHYDSIDNLTYAKGRTPEDIANVLLHENQHAIQGVEGWATGGSPSNTPGFDIDAVMRIKDHVKRLGINPDDIEARIKSGQPVSLAEQERYHKYLGLIEQEKEIYKNSIPNEEAYRRLTGEAQARLTQERQPLTMQQRAEQYPLEGDKVADIPFNQLINRYGGSGDQRSLPETEFSIAHKIAQEHAALPVEQGGLGLPPDNTAMDRARALGFVTAPKKELYHGTTSDFSEIDPTRSDLGFHVGNVKQAEARLKNRAWGEKIGPYSLGTNIMPLMENKYSNLLRLKDVGSFHAPHIAEQLEKKGLLEKGKEKIITDYVNTPTDGDSFKSPTWIERQASQDDLIRRVLDDEGYGGVVYRNNGEGDSIKDSKAFINPSFLRSRFAAFDPFKKDSANILASLLLGTTLASQQDKK